MNRPASLEELRQRSAYRDAGGAWCSEGRRRFVLTVRAALAALKGDRPQSPKEVAADLQRTVQYLGQLLSGRARPSGELQMRIWVLHKSIEPHLWYLAPKMPLSKEALREELESSESLSVDAADAAE